MAVSQAQQGSLRLVRVRPAQYVTDDVVSFRLADVHIKESRHFCFPRLT